MNESHDIVINKLPMRTWNHMKMNEATLKNVIYSGIGSFEIVRSEGFAGKIGEMAADGAKRWYSQITTGAGNAVDEEIKALNVKPMVVEAGSESVPGENESDEFVRFNFEFGKDSACVNAFAFEVAEGESLTVYMDLCGNLDASGNAIVQVKVNVKKNGLVRLVTIQRETDNMNIILDIGSRCEENAKFELTQLMIGAGNLYNGCETLLDGKESKFAANLGYMRNGAGKLDMNYTAKHTGIRSESEINASGALSDKAFKLFRGTLDFVKGGKTAVGAETEDVFLMNEGVVNQTIPLILCGEEDVSGAHGASIGSPDDETVFYLMSRGIEKNEAVDMLAMAKVNSVIAKMPNEEVREEMFEYISNVRKG